MSVAPEAASLNFNDHHRREVVTQVSTSITTTAVQPLTHTDVYAVALAPITVRCAFCRAGVGHRCRSRNGSSAEFHAPRKKAIAHLPEAERIAAYQAWHDRQAAAREAMTTADGRSGVSRDAVRALVDRKALNAVRRAGWSHQ